MLDCTAAYGLDFLFPAGDQAVGASLRRHGEFARVELDFLVEMAGGSGTLIDVGANIGAIALPFAKARPDWRVVAIEASRNMHGVLAANILNNRLHSVEAHHAAAGSAPGLAEFPTLPFGDAANFGALGFNSKTGATETVRVLALDDVAPEDTRLIKIDVEGFEPQVLAGATRLIADHKAIWLVETTIQNSAASTEVIKTFQDAGYAVHWFYAPFATPRSVKDTPAQPAYGDSNIVALPPGAANAWNLSPVNAPGDKRPSHVASYPYLARYGYS